MTQAYENLAQQLRGAVAERAPQRRPRRRPTLAVTIVGLGLVGAATAGAVVVTNSLSGVDSAASDSGDASFAEALATPEISTYGGDPSSTKRVEVDGRTWNFAWGDDGSLCVRFPGRSTSCATRNEVAAGDLAVTVAEPPTREQQAKRAKIIREMKGSGALPKEAKLPPTPATRFGIAVDGIERVRAIAKDGSTIAEATVTKNTYVVKVGLEGDAARIDLLDATGKVARAATP